MVKEVVNTPEGTASYPWLNTPDTKFGTPGNYKCGLVLDPAEAGVDSFIEKYNKFAEQAKADCIVQIEEALSEIPDNPKNKAKRQALQAIIDDIDEKFKDPLQPQYDDAGELTGKMILQCSSRASIPDKKTGGTISLKPDAYDATGNVMEEVPAIMGGARLRLKITLKNYFIPANKICGITKPNIHAFQVVKLTSGGAGGGFGAVEGGYVQEQKVEPSFDDEDLESAEYE